MSKLDDIKINQGYTTTPKNCGNCKSYTSKFEYPGWVKTSEDKKQFDENGYFKNEKEIRCGQGGFKVKKTAVCDLHEMKA